MKNKKFEKFDFEKEVRDNYGDDIKVFTEKLSIFANTKKIYISPGIYALYENNQLKKIGKAVYGGIHHRMVQYYNMNNSGGSEYISISNRNEIEVRFFILEDTTELWYAERRFQVIAHDCGESMEWENTSRN